MSSILILPDMSLTMKSQTCVCEPVCRRAPPRPFSVLLAWRDARTAAASLAEMPADRELIREHTETRTLLRMTGHRDFINDTHDCMRVQHMTVPLSCSQYARYLSCAVSAAAISAAAVSADVFSATAFSAVGLVLDRRYLSGRCLSGRCLSRRLLGRGSTRAAVVHARPLSPLSLLAPAPSSPRS